MSRYTFKKLKKELDVYFGSDNVVFTDIFGDKTLATSSYEGKQTLYTQNLLRAKEFFEEKVSKLENIEQKKEQ